MAIYDCICVCLRMWSRIWWKKIFTVISRPEFVLLRMHSVPWKPTKISFGNFNILIIQQIFSRNIRIYYSFYWISYIMSSSASFSANKRTLFGNLNHYLYQNTSKYKQFTRFSYLPISSVSQYLIFISIFLFLVTFYLI